MLKIAYLSSFVDFQQRMFVAHTWNLQPEVTVKVPTKRISKTDMIATDLHIGNKITVYNGENFF